MRPFLCAFAYSPAFLVDCGDYVTVTNANKVVVTGRKAEQIVYRHHTMWPGGLKEIKYETMMEKKPEEVSPLPLILCIHLICCWLDHS